MDSLLVSSATTAEAAIGREKEKSIHSTALPV